MFKLKYITKGQETLFILYMLAGMFLCYGVVYSTCYFIWGYHDTPIYVGPGFLLLGIIIWGFCFYNSDTRRRNRYKKHGECFPGVIVGADWYSIHEWFLIIEFEENGEKKLKYTQGYSGNPNDYLQSCKCNIYKWRGRYIEADLQVKQSRKQIIELRIPIMSRELAKELLIDSVAEVYRNWDNVKHISEEIKDRSVASGSVNRLLSQSSQAGNTRDQMSNEVE